ncbi:MAG TPA: GGDEF domain-containing protein [Bdellovibrionota bacterium]|nr:GGDEF domain-containing protein [Bdellovibrionota bacterium]
MVGKKRPDKTTLVEDQELQEKLERAKQTQPSLVLIAGKPLGKRFPINPPQVVIGRSAEVDIRIDVPQMSRRHSVIKIEEDKAVIEDLGSTNGTFVNDVRVVRPIVLAEGDHIRCGKSILKYIPKGSIESLYHEDIHGMAHIDNLTKVYNKMYLLDCLRIEFSRSKNLEADLSIIMLDLDHFKQVNDTLGHEAGDYALRETISTIKQKVLRAEDLIGRYGGEEFVIILSDTPKKRAADIAERLRTAVESHHFEYEGKEIPLNISLGVTSLDPKDRDPVDLIRRADEALYEAKRTGRNRVCSR